LAIVLVTPLQKQQENRFFSKGLILLKLILQAVEHHSLSNQSEEA